MRPLDQPMDRIDGYRILRLSDESPAELDEAITRGVCDGIALNPFAGWNRDFKVLYELKSVPKALVIPFGDRIGFEPKYLHDAKAIEMVLLGEFTGSCTFEGNLLRVLRIECTCKIEINQLSRLRLLCLRKFHKADLSELFGKFNSLHTLELNEGVFTTLSGIESFTTLKKLEISYARNLHDIAAITRLEELEDLTIQSARKIRDLPETLERIPSLRVLRLLDCGALSDLSFLDKLSLREFRCSRTKIADFEPEKLARIQTVYVDQKQIRKTI